MNVRLVMATVLASIAVVTVLVLGVRGTSSTRPPLQPFSDMVDQPKYRPQSASVLFADGRAQRSPPAGAVAWGRHAQQPHPRFLLEDETSFGLAAPPVPLDRALLLKGQRLYHTYCRICHGETGAGNGITTQYGMILPPSYHGERLRAMPAGEVYKVITVGKGQMGPYADKIESGARWAIVAYVRALQRANAATLADVPEVERRSLEAGGGQP